MLTGPRSLDQLTQYLHAFQTQDDEKEETKRPDRTKRSIDWEKELETFRKKAAPNRPENARIMDIIVNVGYSENIDQIMRVIEKVLKETDEILHDPKPEMALGDLTDNVVQIHVKPWCPKNEYWKAMTQLLKNLKIMLFREGISYKSIKNNS